MAKSKTYTLTPHDTVSYADEAPHTVTLFMRDGPDTIVGVRNLDAEFEHSWQAAITRKHVIAAGEINLDNWVESNPYTPPAF